MAGEPTRIVHPGDLIHWGGAHEPFGPEPFLFLDLSVRGTVDSAVASALAAAPVPVIGVVDGASHPLAASCDALVTPGEVDAVAARIRRSPLAAMTLVQVLRATQGMSAAHALTLESLAYATLQGGPEFARWRATHVRKSAPVADPGPPVLVERDGAAVEIRLNRPSRANAMSVEMRDALVEAFELLALDDTIERATVSGSGANFSTGGDLDEFGLAPDPATAHAVRTIRLPARALLPSRARTTFVLHGACVGAGIELPAFAARVVARADARFQLPELDFGLIPGAGGCVGIPRRIGRQRTAWMVLTGRCVDADTALRWRLVDEIVR